MKLNIDDLSDEEKRDLAHALAPWVAQAMLEVTTVFGPNERVVAHQNAVLNDTHFNTQCGTISIDEDVFFGTGCSVITGTHDIFKFGQERIESWRAIQTNDIYIGKGVWIGNNATILGPCTIGPNAVIAAGAVLLPGKYEGHIVYAGVPATSKRSL